MPPWAAVGVGFGVAGALALLFPFRGSEHAFGPPPGLALAARAPAPASSAGAGSSLLRPGEDYAAAAARLFAAHERARSVDESRRLFAAALRALLAANRPDLALVAGQVRQGALSADAATQLLLARVALAADRPSEAQAFALRAAAPLLDAPAPTHRSARLDAGADERLRLAYDTSLGVARLDDAVRAAQAAVRLDPARPDWRERLLQAATWSNRPALALEQARALARTGAGTDGARWRDLLQRARALHQDDATVEALERLAELEPRDAARARELAQAYEAQGDVAAAERALRRAAGEAPPAQRAAFLEQLAQLARRAGDDEAAIDAMRRALALEAHNPPLALDLARLLARRGRAPQAALVLLAGADLAQATDPDALRDGARILRDAGRLDEARAALQRLLALDKADLWTTIDALTLVEQQSPRAAARIAAERFARHHEPEMAQRALGLVARTSTAAELRAWLGAFDEAMERAAATDPYFLVDRAQLRIRLGQPAGAVRDARLAVAREPRNPNFRAALLWTLISARAVAPLRAEIARYTPQILAGTGPEPVLADPLAAALLAVHESDLALPFLRRRARAGSNPLWWLAVADAEEQSGHADLARRARNRALAQIERAAPRRPAPGAADAWERARVQLALALAFESGDAARARIRALAAPLAARAHGRDPESRGEAQEDSMAIVLGDMVAREPDTLGQAWLISLYGRASTGLPAAAPGWARLQIALAQDDRAAMSDVLDEQPEWLAPAEAVDAASRLGRLAQAQTLAFEQMQRSADDDALVPEFRRLATVPPENPAAASGSFVEAGVRSFVQQPLREFAQWAGAAVPLTQSLAIGAQASQTRRSGDDPAQIVNVPGSEHESTIFLRASTPGAQSLQLDLEQRQAMSSVAAAALRWIAPQAGGLTLDARAGWHQDTVDSVFLRVGGVRDGLSVSAQDQWSATDHAALALQVNRYASQAGGTVGDGSVWRLDLVHDFRLAYPDLSAYAAAASLRYHAFAGLDPQLATLLPLAQRAGATNAAFLTPSTNQFELGATAGASVRTEGSRALRPYASLGYVHDQIAGGAPEWELGVAGSVLGTDAFSLGYRGGTALGNGLTAPQREWILRYRWFF